MDVINLNKMLKSVTIQIHLSTIPVPIYGERRGWDIQKTTFLGHLFLASTDDAGH